MTRRGWIWVAVLAVADALIWALTLHAQASFHATPGGAVTSLGIVPGWLASIVFLIAITLILLAARQAKAYQHRTDPAGNRAGSAPAAGRAAAPPATGAAGGAA
jgi:hypothetical protein